MGAPTGGAPGPGEECGPMQQAVRVISWLSVVVFVVVGIIAVGLLFMILTRGGGDRQ